ncbi:uncharacterized protein LOC131166271 [Malania oleifera]|uniref:uncharacterized protein LOC131166271 n=1 Tax=Malania oleifera TaxID=397392 RepID=UPI0025AE75ED|nr:uncharacterized protein LOC131166271 [Malania oleifera]
MPSVGMRRSTRVLVVKGADGARVLRSGRRLWPESDAEKLERVAIDDEDEWLRVVQGSEDGDGVPNCKVNGWKQGVTAMDVDAVVGGPESVITMPSSLDDDDGANRMWGFVYRRKRKMSGWKSCDASEKKKRALEDRMYGRYYVRRQRRESNIGSFAADDVSCVVRRRHNAMLTVVVDSSCSRASWLVPFLSAVLGHMTRVRLRLRKLSAFLMSTPICEVFSSYGIHFLLDPSPNSFGICTIFGASCFVPLFSVDFSAVPQCFLYMQINMLLKSRYFPSLSATCSLDGVGAEGDIDTNDDNLSCITSVRDLCGSKTMPDVNADSANMGVLSPIGVTPKLPPRNAQRRNGFNSSIQTRRRSRRRSTRGRNSSFVSINKANGALVPSSFSTRRDGISFSLTASNREPRSSFRRSSTANIKELKSTVVGVREDIDLMCCSANILVSEPDRCYREVGAKIMLEFSASLQWVIAVKSDGSLRYSHVAQKVMRPSTSNRFTHSTIWTGEDGWKLEFPNRQDWLIFRELYKECSARNMQAPAAKIIPVPGVREVSDYEDSYSVSFFRPDSYIHLNDDEVSRSMAKRTANYDMDSEDDEWLNKFNNEKCAENELRDRVSEETFELMVDAFEKAQFCSPDDYSDEKAAVNLCLELAKREVVEAVYNYWMRRRKQKRSALVKVFQGHQTRKAQTLPKPVLRRRRTFKRLASQPGRGKQWSVLQAIAAERDAPRDALEEHNAMHRVEEAKAAANRSVEQAVAKRRRAQILMEIADLAAYKATKALRIADAARIGASPDASAACFLE